MVSPEAKTSMPELDVVVADKASVAEVKSIVTSFAFTVIPLPAPIFNVVEPPRDTAPPSVKPVPAVTVRDEFASSLLSICPAGTVTVPPDTFKPPDNVITVLVLAPLPVTVASVSASVPEVPSAPARPSAPAGPKAP